MPNNPPTTTHPVEECASLAEDTVQNAEQHATTYNPPKARTKPRPGFAAYAAKVDPRVLAEAKRLAKGDASRLVIHDAETVTVGNPRHDESIALTRARRAQRNALRKRRA